MSTVPESATSYYENSIEEVLIDEETLSKRVKELAEATAARHADDPEDLILICVLKGAVMFLTDFSRALPIPNQMEFMAVSSYGAGTSSSGVVRILKDLERDITGRDVVILEDILDSGLTLSWLLRNLSARNPRSLEVVTLLRKPEARQTVNVECTDVGFDIDDDFVVGYGLDFNEQFRSLPFVAKLKPEVFQ
jgi:hypoxanthine phosphoribosyltransferase